MAATRAPRSAARTERALAVPTKRRLISAAAVLFFLAGGLAGWFWLATRHQASSGPVILVVIDTLRADRLPVYGYKSGRAPVLTAFANEGVVFDRAYSHAPQTLPSHVSMFTGHLPFEHKVRDNLGFTLARGTPTMASMFQGAGYKTGAFVSAYVLRPETGVAAGFDVYDANFPPVAADRSIAQVQRPGPETLAAADAWLKTLTSGRFFLFLHLYEPHKPYRAPDRFGDLSPYDGEVAYADEIVGTLFARLKERGFYDRATIVVLADHGEGLGDHIEEEHGLFLYDEVIRVPWMMRLPGGQAAGRRIKDPVQHIDLLPTLAALGGLTPPPGLRGRDLSESGQTSPASDSRLLLPCAPGWTPWSPAGTSIRHRRFRTRIGSGWRRSVMSAPNRRRRSRALTRALIRKTRRRSSAATAWLSRP
jgi:arylsulfatase A-like enzyme